MPNTQIVTSEVLRLLSHSTATPNDETRATTPACTMLSEVAKRGGHLYYQLDWSFLKSESGSLPTVGGSPPAINA